MSSRLEEMEIEEFEEKYYKECSNEGDRIFIKLARFVRPELIFKSLILICPNYLGLIVLGELDKDLKSFIMKKLIDFCKDN